MNNHNFPSKTNKNLFQGYIFSTSRSKFNLVQMRILYRIVEFAQCEIEGILLKDNKCKIEHSLRHVDLSIPTSCVMTEGSKHYDQAAAACRALQKEQLWTWDAEAKEYRGAPIIYNVTIKKNTGVMNFSVAQWLWDSILDFSRGFRKIELAVVLTMRSTNSMKMYQLLADQEYPINYNLEWLKDYFGVKDKYDQSSDFIRKVIVPAQEEMKKMCPTGFDFKPMKTGRRISGILFKPFKQPENQDKNLERQALLAQISTRPFIGAEIYRYMKYNMEFEADELARNKQLLHDLGQLHEDPMRLLSSIQSRRRTADGQIKGKGWVIAAIRSELANCKKKS